MSEPLDTTGVDIDQLPSDISDSDLFLMIHDTPDSAFLEFDINQTPKLTEPDAYQKAELSLDKRTSRVSPVLLKDYFDVVKEEPTWSNLKRYLNILAQYGETANYSLGTYANIIKMGILTAMPKTTKEKIEEQQIMAKGFLNGAERNRRGALVSRKYLDYEKGQRLTRAAVDNMSMAIGSLRNVKHLKSI